MGWRASITIMVLFVEIILRTVVLWKAAEPVGGRLLDNLLSEQKAGQEFSTTSIRKAFTELVWGAAHAVQSTVQSSWRR